ncbi:hypothetical protein THAOC_08752, partial [Thalassiosira oceanica]
MAMAKGISKVICGVSFETLHSHILSVTSTSSSCGTDVDWDNHHCVQDCAGSNCGGLAAAHDETFDSPLSCCEQMLSWLNFEDCVKLNGDDEPETAQTRMGGSIRKTDIVEEELVGYRIADELDTEILTRQARKRPIHQQSQSSSSSLRPTDDAFISRKNMEMNFGTIDMLQYNREDEMLLRFDLTNVQNVDKAVLKLYPVGGKCTGLEVSVVFGDWNEKLVSWFTAPSARGPRSTRSPKAKGGNSDWVRVDVSRAVTYALSVKRQSYVTLRISGEKTSDRGVFASKEYRSGQFSPQLSVRGLEMRAKALKDTSSRSKVQTQSSISKKQKGNSKPKNKPNNKPGKPKKSKPKPRPNNKPAKPLVGKKPK